MENLHGSRGFISTGKPDVFHQQYSPEELKQKPQNRCISKPYIINGTPDGQNPALVDKQFILLFTGFYTSQWCRISSTNSMKTKMHSSKQVGQRCHPPRICAKGPNPVAVTIHHGVPPEIVQTPGWSWIFGNPPPNLLTSPKSNKKRKNDCLENVSAFKYGFFGYLYQISGGCPFQKALSLNLSIWGGNLFRNPYGKEGWNSRSGRAPAYPTTSGVRMLLDLLVLMASITFSVLKHVCVHPSWQYLQFDSYAGLLQSIVPFRLSNSDDMGQYIWKHFQKAKCQKVLFPV